MLSKRAGIVAGILGLALLCSCGDAQPDQGRGNQALGGTKYGAPLAQRTPDVGILKDQTTYQPSKATTTGGGGGGATARGPARGGAAPTGGGDARAELTKIVRDLRAALQDGDVELALRFFNPEHVAVLGDNERSKMVDTLIQVDQIRRRAGEKFDPAKRDSVMNALFGFPTGEPNPDVLDAEHVTVSPNPAMLLFGPAKTTPNLTFVRTEGDWKAQLAAPLTADDAKAIVAFHEALLGAIEQIAAALDAGAVPLDALVQAVTAAREGKPVELGASKEGGGAPDGDKDAKPKGEGEEPKPEDGEKDDGATPHP